MYVARLGEEVCVWKEKLMQNKRDGNLGLVRPYEGVNVVRYH